MAPKVLALSIDLAKLDIDAPDQLHGLSESAIQEARNILDGVSEQLGFILTTRGSIALRDSNDNSVGIVTIK